MKTLVLVLFVMNFFDVNIAQAYVGPGAGLTAIGSIIAFLGSVLLLIMGFLWYPIKRFFKSRGDRKNKT